MFTFSKPGMAFTNEGVTDLFLNSILEVCTGLLSFLSHAASSTVQAPIMVTRESNDDLIILICTKDQSALFPNRYGNLMVM